MTNGNDGFPGDPNEFRTGSTGEGDGDSAIGLTLYDFQGNFVGTLFQIGSGPLASERVFLRGPNGNTTLFQGGEFLTALGGQPDQAIRIDAQGNITRASSASRFLPSAARGGGARAAAPAFSSTREAQVLAQRHDVDLLNRRHQQEVELLNRQIAAAIGAEKQRLKNELRLLQERHRLELEILGKQQEFQERMSLTQQASTLAQQASQFQIGLSQQAAEMTGRDPLRSAISLSGGLQSGATPAQALRGRLISLAGQELPQVNRGAGIPDLQSTVEQLQQFLQTPIIPPAFGLAEGGTILMKRRRGPSGEDRFEMEPADQPGVAVLVGEGRDGEGIAAGTAEVLEILPDRVRIIPLVGGAQGGGSFNPFSPGTTIEDLGGPFNGGFSFPDFATPTAQGLAPIFQHLGFGGVPFAQETRGPGLGFGLSVQGALGQDPVSAPAFSSDLFGQLGVSPRLFRVGRQVFVRGANNELFAIRDKAQFEEMGLRSQDIIDVGSLEELSEVASGLGLVGQGGGFGVRQLPQDGVPIVGDFEPLGQLSTPIIMPTGTPGQGIFLPTPERLAALWGTLDPTTQQLFLQAYDIANIPPATVLSRMQAFTPSGSARLGLAAAPRLG